MTELKIYKAQACPGQHIPNTTIIIDEEWPDIPAIEAKRESDWRPIMATRFEREAEQLDEALHSCLPGGTYDALFAQMARRKASLFMVRH